MVIFFENNQCKRKIFLRTIKKSNSDNSISEHIKLQKGEDCKLKRRNQPTCIRLFSFQTKKIVAGAPVNLPGATFIGKTM